MNEHTEDMDVTGVKVAIIDDAKTIRMMMSHTLKGMGCEVECAEDGYKALSMLRRFKPEDTRNTPVVMLSSSDGIFDIAKGQARGATAHVTKIPPEAVLRKLIFNYTGADKAA